MQCVWKYVIRRKNPHISPLGGRSFELWHYFVYLWSVYHSSLRISLNMIERMGVKTYTMSHIRIVSITIGNRRLCSLHILHKILISVPTVCNLLAKVKKQLCCTKLKGNFVLNKLTNYNAWYMQWWKLWPQHNPQISNFCIYSL